MHWVVQRQDDWLPDANPRRVGFVSHCRYHDLDAVPTMGVGLSVPGASSAALTVQTAHSRCDQTSGSG